MAVPACFGELWEGLEGSDCMRCRLEKDCLAKFATTKLVEVQRSLGGGATIEALSASTSVAVPAIRLALDFQSNGGVAAPLASEENPVEEKQVGERPSLSNDSQGNKP